MNRKKLLAVFHHEKRSFLICAVCGFAPLATICNTTKTAKRKQTDKFCRSVYLNTEILESVKKVFYLFVCFICFLFRFPFQIVIKSNSPLLRQFAEYSAAPQLVTAQPTKYAQPTKLYLCRYLLYLPYIR